MTKRQRLIRDAQKWAERLNDMFFLFVRPRPCNVDLVAAAQEIEYSSPRCDSRGNLAHLPMSAKYLALAFAVAIAEDL
jgi:hypothetical protein